MFLRQARVEAQRLPDGSLLLFDTASETAVPLNESGAFIWEMCDGSHSVDQIVDNLAGRYDAERSQVDRDTRAFLDVLIGQGLVERQSPSS